jgi:hypothetical protein
MAEALVKTLKRDSVRVNPIPDAATALAAIAGWMKDHNTVHPHSRLGCRSPRRMPLTTRASQRHVATSRPSGLTGSTPHRSN